MTTPDNNASHPVPAETAATAIATALTQLAEGKTTEATETLRTVHDAGIETGVILSDDARAVIAGLLAPAEVREGDGGVNHDGINGGAQVWAEVRAAFPRELFDTWADQGDDVDEDDLRYNPDAGF